MVEQWTPTCIFRAVEVACPFPFGPARALVALSSGGARRNTGLQDLADFCDTDLLGRLVGRRLMIAPDS